MIKIYKNGAKKFVKRNWRGNSGNGKGDGVDRLGWEEPGIEERRLVKRGQSEPWDFSERERERQRETGWAATEKSKE